MGQRNLVLILIVTLVFIGVIFPTPRIRTMEDLVETLDCSKTLEDGELLSVIWDNMQGNTRIVVSISSNEDVQVLLMGMNSKLDTFYSLSQKTHNVQYVREYPSYKVIVWNPTWSDYDCDICNSMPGGNWSYAEVSGSIEAYHVYETQVWLPWWAP